MYFSEVDVDVLQPRSREPTVSLTFVSRFQRIIIVQSCSVLTWTYYAVNVSLVAVI